MSRFLMRSAVPAAVLLGICLQADLQFTVVGQEKSPATTASTKKKLTAAENVVKIERAEIKVIDRVELAAARSGILSFVEPREGDQVRADQTVAGLKDEVARAEVKTAKAQAENDIEIRYAQKAFTFAKKDLEKSMEANRKVRGAFSLIDLEEKTLAAEKSGLQIEQTEWQFEVNKYKADQAQSVLDQYSVVAPFDGVVTKVVKSKGEAVREGDIILEITSTKRMKVEGYLHYTQAYRVKQGDPVTVVLNIPDKTLKAAQQTFRGRIRFVDVKASPIKEEVLIWAEVENVNNLMLAGLEATMTIHLLSEDKRKAAGNRSGIQAASAGD